MPNNKEIIRLLCEAIKLLREEDEKKCPVSENEDLKKGDILFDKENLSYEVIDILPEGIILSGINPKGASFSVSKESLWELFGKRKKE